MHSELIKCKYSKNVVVDVIKKLILNRFLLDPALYYSYSELIIGEELLTVMLNKIKTLFYPKKAQIENL
jgi:hypothetical protein